MTTQRKGPMNQGEQNFVARMKTLADDGHPQSAKVEATKWAKANARRIEIRKAGLADILDHIESAAAQPEAIESAAAQPEAKPAGYKGRRPGSPKELAHKAYDAWFSKAGIRPEDCTRAQRAEVFEVMVQAAGVKPVTVRTWFYHFKAAFDAETA